MADKAIGSLVEATVINDADRFVLEQGGQAKKISGATMISELAEALDGHGGIQSIDLVGGEGNAKTYRITYTDGTTYDYVVRDGESGNYAVVAGNLAPYSDASGATQSIPFLSQGTGRGNGSATVSAGNYCQLKKKLGNTVCVNQLSPTNKINFSGTGDGGWWALSDNISAISGHIYLIYLTGSIPAGSLFRIRDATQGWVGSQHGSSFIWTSPGNSTATTVLQHNIPTGLAYNINHTSHDLTLWFGSNDRIPSDLLAHPENWGRYYAGSLDYAAGYLDSADGSVLTSISRNVFDGQTEKGYYNDNTGAPQTQTSGNYWRSVNYVEVIPNTSYYAKVADGYTTSNSNITLHFYDENKTFISSKSNAGNRDTTTPANCRFIRLSHYFVTATQTPPQGICISLYYSGESGYDQYYPYTVLAEVDTGSEVLRSAGAVADEKTPDGTITRRVGVVDLGTLNWSAISRTRFETSSPISGLKYNPSAIQLSNIQSGRYETVSFNTIYQTDTDKCISAYNESAYIQVRDTSYTTAAAFKTAMSGVYLYYELDTPTTEQGTAFAENIPCDPAGSMSWENTKGIPQGAEIFYSYDYAGTLDSMIDALPSANGTYTLKATVASGKITYSWVAG